MSREPTDRYPEPLLGESMLSDIQRVHEKACKVVAQVSQDEKTRSKRIGHVQLRSSIITHAAIDVECRRDTVEGFTVHGRESKTNRMERRSLFS